MTTLDGKVAIVTGAGRGIGRAHALALAERGARVVVNDLGVPAEGSGSDQRPAQQVVDDIAALGGAAVANYDDVADWAGAENLIKQAIEDLGGLDILVNNAGILRDAMSFNLDEAAWDAVITVHLKGHFAPSHFAAAHWRERTKAGDAVTGRIINTSSESGLFGNPGQSNYAAAKGGIAALTLVLARELERYGVTVNAIAPRARTRMTEQLMAGFQVEEGAWDPVDPDNVAPLVAWLASDDAAHVSGQLFIVWGGQIMLTRPYTVAATIDAGNRAWDVDELTEATRQLFADHEPGVPPSGVQQV